MISSQYDIIMFFIVSDSAIQSYLKFHPLFNTDKACEETETKLDFVSYIWDDDRIHRIDESNW